MTATAAENKGGLRPFYDQKRMISSTLSVLSDLEIEPAIEMDHAGRCYVENRGVIDGEQIDHIVAMILGRLGIEDVHVLALREAKAIHDEFAVGEEGDDVYLSDGMWMTQDGRLVQK